MSTYPYSSLNLPFETRILTVHPGSEDDDLVCSLSHMSLKSDAEQEIDYEALSYCWSQCSEREPPTPSTSVLFTIASGDGRDFGKTFYEQFQHYPSIPALKPLYYKLGGRAPEGMIICDEIPILVGGELYAALKCQRAFHEGNEFKIWVDALCINQNDVTERNVHVKIMDKIYEGASVVRIWLGEQFGKENDGLSALQQIETIRLDLAKNKKLDGNRSAVQDAFYAHEKYESIEWDAIASLLARSWFRRVWVIQEVAHAKEATVHIGELALEWEVFAEAIRYMQMYSFDSEMDEVVDEIRCLSTMIWLHVNVDLKKQEDIETPEGLKYLLSVLAETRTFKSTLPVDKFYGLLSFFPTASKLIEVDYRITTEEVFTKFTMTQLCKYGNIAILNHCTPPSGKKVLNIPSWVPDWTQNTYTEPFCIRGLISKATGNIKAKFTIDPDRKILRIFGKLVDRIAHVEKVRRIPGRSNYWTSEIRSEGNLHTIEKIRKEESKRETVAERKWHESVLKIVTKNLSRPIPEQLWRVFMCNRTRENEVPNQSCELAYKMTLTTMFWESSTKSALESARETEDIPDTKEIDEALSEFSGAFQKWCYNRRFFETERGFFGWAMDGVQEGDEVCLFYGGDYPFVIRPMEDGRHEIVSDCFVHGFMDGEALNEDFEEHEFCIQ